MPDGDTGSEAMQALVSRIRTELVRKGWSQTRLEEEGGFAQGSLTRILRGKQQRVWPQTLARIATALGIPPEELSAPSASVGATSPAHGVPLGDVAGYRDAELEVARLEPKIPVEVFQMARKTRLAVAPEVVTVKLLRDHVRFLNEHLSGVRTKPGRQGRELRRSKKSKRQAG